MKLIHAADLHLDSPFEALPEEQAAQRRAEQRELLLRLAALCRTEGAELLLLAGDLLDSERAYYETGALLAEAFAGLSIPVCIAPGNHDYWSPSSPWALMDLPENVHVFSESRPTALELPGCRVWGAAFGEKSCPGLLSGFSLPAGDRLEIMVLHGDLFPNSRYNPLTEAEIEASGLDYLALGHIHTASGLRRAGGTFYAWPGCTEGRGFDECGQKGVYAVELEKGACDLRFVPLGGRRYEILEVDLSQARDQAAALRAALPAGAERDIYRLILRGEVEESPDLPALERALAGCCFSLQLRDGTSLRRDIWAQAAEDSLKGIFLRRMQARLAAAGDEGEREKLTLAVRYGLAALEKGEEPQR